MSKDKEGVGVTKYLHNPSSTLSAFLILPGLAEREGVNPCACIHAGHVCSVYLNAHCSISFKVLSLINSSWSGFHLLPGLDLQSWIFG